MALRTKDSSVNWVNFPSNSFKNQELEELGQAIIDSVHSLERQHKFSFKRLRTIAKNQLFILIKKSLITNSPDMYQGEIEKLIGYELSI